MSRILKISESDYKVKVKSGGTITFDTGVEAGETIVTGNLTVKGVTTTINTTNTTIEDNVIILNNGETNINPATGLPDKNYGTPHAGVTEGTAGIEVDRGGYVNSQILFDETTTWYDYLANVTTPGTWIIYGGRFTKKIGGLRVNSISNDSTQDIAFDFNNSTKALRVVRSPFYESYVTDDNHIPNRKFVTDYITSGEVTPGMADVDRLYISDPDDTANPYAILRAYGTNQIDGTLQVSVGGNVICTFSGGGLTFKNNINIAENTLTNISSSNLLITAANGNVELSAVVNFTNRTDSIPSAQTVTVGKTKLFSSTLGDGAGKTNLYYTTRRNGEDVKDELVSKNRALLFSMLF